MKIKSLFFTLAVSTLFLAVSCQKEVFAGGDDQNDGYYSFDFNVERTDFETESKGDATVGWTEGDKLFVFFKPSGGKIISSGYVTLVYSGTSWAQSSASSVAANALGEGGTMAAVYVPCIGSSTPSYSNGKWSLNGGDVYYSRVSDAVYTLDQEKKVTGRLAFSIPDGYVQFAVPATIASEGDPLNCNLVDAYNCVSLDSDFTFTETPVTGGTMIGHKIGDQVFFWGKRNNTSSETCEFSLKTSLVAYTLEKSVSSSLVKKNKAYKLDFAGEPVEDNFVPEPTTWAAYNNLARTGTADATVIDPQDSGYPKTKEKFVGTFYFIWHDSNSVSGGPYDVQAYLGAGNYNFNNYISYGGKGKTHHWGQPYLGYYKDSDEWVLRKHAQMLADAGVDFIAFDTTNDAFYENEITKLCNLYVQMRSEGYRTPQLTFMIWHSKAGGSTSNYKEFNHDNAVTNLYNKFYTNSKYKDLWFKWEGKPLMMAIGQHVTNSTIKNYFTFRPTWYLWNKNWQTVADANDPWYTDAKTSPKGSADPKDRKWPWGVCYTGTDSPMRAGTRDGKNEFCPVSPATHPVSNLGRSFVVGNEWQTYNYYEGGVKKTHVGTANYPKEPAKGTYFKQQFAAAQALDPEIMFFTGWNEFLMGYFDQGTLEFNYCGGVNATNGLFVDQYNNEYSRDIEPISGDFGDNYYYYMVDFIRKFKGVKNTPVYNRYHTVNIDGDFTDWSYVESGFADDKEDNKIRNSAGYGNIGTLVNTTGRNDLRICKVANDGVNLCFYVKAAGDIKGYSNGENGLNLFLNAGTSASNWEGFNYKVVPASSTMASLYRSTGGYNWEKVCDVKLSVSGSTLELAVPMTSLGITSAGNVKMDFKWVDNVDLSQSDGIQRCMRDGDSAPNGRFRYRYVFENN